MTDTFLLGAGASKEAGIPTSREMVQSILAHFEASREEEGDPHRRMWRRVKNDPTPAERDTEILYFVVAGLQLGTAISRRNPITVAVDVEQLFSAVEMLRQRRTLEIAPFVATWHPHLDQFDVRKPAAWFFENMLIDAIAPALAGELRRDRQLPFTPAHPDIARAVGRITGEERATGPIVEDPAGMLTQAVLDLLIERLEKPTGARRPPGTDSGEKLPAARLEDRVARFVDDRFAHPPDGAVFGEVAKRMIAALVDLVWIQDTAKTAYLAPLVSYAAKHDALVATLNYDNSLELQAGATGLRCSNGIESWSQGKDVAWADGTVRLLKLHGSIDWKLERKELPLPLYQISMAERSQTRAGDFQPAIIFGQRNKLTAEGPFLDLLRAFTDTLERTDRLTVIGYSFRDDHVNVQITRWLQRSEGRTLRIIDPGFEASEAEYATQLRYFRDRNPHRVQVIAEGAGPALTQLLDEAS